MAGEALVWCEVRKNIEILQLIVSVKQQERKQEGNHMCGDSRSTEITVSSNSVVVKREEKTSQHAKEEETDRCPREIRVTFPDITIEPMSCNSLSVVQEKELQMRLHINSTDSSQNVCSHDSSGYKNIEEERRGLQQGPIEMVCKMCGNTIIKKRQFKRVLELPSEHWQQTSQNLCCHGSISNLSSLQEASLSPAENDCLLGSYFIMVHADNVEAKHLIISQGETMIKCHRCTRPIGDIVIGESHVTGIKINKHAITTCTHGRDVFRNYTVEVFLSRLLHSKLQGRVNFKFLVKGTPHNGESKTYALLWILNADAAAITNICSPTSKYMDRLHEPKCYNNQDPTQATLSHGIKVLYKILINSNNRELKKLVAGKDTIILPSEMCLQLLLILTTSTYTIPPSGRQMEGFMVGYLKS